MTKHWRVFDEAVVVPSAPAKKLPLSLRFTMTRGGGNPQEKRFHLQVSLESTRRLSDYYVEVEFPSAFLNPSTSYSLEIRERRTATHYVFKATPEDFMKILNPGNDNLMGIEFFAKRDGSQQQSMKEIVRATTYWDDIPIAIEHSIEELCNEANPLVFH